MVSTYEGTNCRGRMLGALKNSLLWWSGIVVLDHLSHWARSKPPSLLTPPSPLGSWSRSKSIESCGTCSSGKPALMVHRSPMVLTFMPNRGTMIMPTMTVTSELGTFAPIVPSRGQKTAPPGTPRPPRAPAFPRRSFPCVFSLCDRSSGCPLPPSSPCHVHEFCGLLSAVCRVSPAICWLRGVLVTKWQRWEALGCPSNDAVAQ